MATHISNTGCRITAAHILRLKIIIIAHITLKYCNLEDHSAWNPNELLSSSHLQFQNVGFLFPLQLLDLCLIGSNNTLIISFIDEQGKMHQILQKNSVCKDLGVCTAIWFFLTSLVSYFQQESKAMPVFLCSNGYAHSKLNKSIRSAT